MARLAEDRPAARASFTSMEAMATHHAVAAGASRAAGTAHFVPSVPPAEMDFGRWLAERTPPGAPTVPITPPGRRAALVLPRVRPARPSPSGRLSRRRRGSAPAVHCAYLADIAAVSPRQLAASGLFPFTTERSARQYVRDGRLTAADLGAWPWAVVDGKALPRNWWADRDFALALQEWSVGEPAAALPGAPVPLHPRRYTAAARLPVG